MKILIVDDKAENLYLLETLLKGNGYKIATARNGVEALEKLKKDSIDMIISDILMPEMDGFQLCRKCKKDDRLRKIPFVFYTATYTDKKDEEFALSLGANKFIVKPTEPDVFLKILEGVIEDHKKKTLIAPKRPLEEEAVYLAAYNERLVKKLEKKVLDLERDIAEHKRLESQLRQAQKMEAIGLLAGGIAHDFNNILTAIQGYTDLALTEIQEDNPLYQDIKEIQKASMRAANLTRQLLLFSRRQPMEFTPLDLNKVINDLIKMLNRLIGEDISLTTDLASDLWTVKGDAGTNEQVIMNLVVNARDAMPKGGEIAIKTENLYIDEEYCKNCRDARPGRFVCLSVRDTGVGIDQSIIDRIFEPFFTTKEVGKATGMGLSVVYGIVKQHKGWVNVESSPGKGSIFRIYLPAVSIESEEKEKEKESVSLEELIGKGERILIVEDEESVKEFTKRALSKNRYVVFTATNVQEALDIFQKEKGNFDLIFSDLLLPNGEGPELLEEILKLKPKISVLLTSGYSDEELDRSAIHKGDYPYLQKPYSISDLLRVVRDALKIKGA